MLRQEWNPSWSMPQGIENVVLDVLDPAALVLEPSTQREHSINVRARCAIHDEPVFLQALAIRTRRSEP